MKECVPRIRPAKGGSPQPGREENPDPILKNFIRSPKYQTMPIGRRYRKKRSMPRNMAKRRSRFRSVNKLRRQVHYYKRTFRVGDFVANYNATTGVTTPINVPLSFNLNQLPAASEFTNLYDQYKISGIRVNCQPLLTEGIASAVSGSTLIYGFPKFSSVIDFDDTFTPVNEDVLLQYGSLKQTGAFKEHKRYFKPRVRGAALDSGAVVAAATSLKAPWIDMSNPNVPHYGVKLFHPGPIASGTPLVSSSIGYSVYATLYIACKNVR